MDRAEFARWAAENGMELSEAQLAAFDRFRDSLYEANEVMNLTRVPAEECWLRHFADSLLFQDLIPRDSYLLDLGTGPGFPAWPIACARPDVQVTAVDSSGKMLGFLQRQPLPNLSTILVRAEEWSAREQFDFVTGRAIAPLSIQLELSAGPCAIGGRIVPMRTPTEEFDVPYLRLLGLRYVGAETRNLPETDVQRAFPIYEKVAATPERFPRRWADIKAKPL